MGVLGKIKEKEVVYFGEKKQTNIGAGKGIKDNNSICIATITLVYSYLDPQLFPFQKL